MTLFRVTMLMKKSGLQKKIMNRFITMIVLLKDRRTCKSIQLFYVYAEMIKIINKLKKKIKKAYVI